MNTPVITPRESYAYLLWRVGERRTQLPRFRYETYDAAEADALAESKRTGGTIYILRQIAKVRPAGTEALEPATSGGDSGGVPKALDANDGVVPPSDVNGVQARGGASHAAVIDAPNPANPAPFMTSEGRSDG